MGRADRHAGDLRPEVADLEVHLAFTPDVEAAEAAAAALPASGPATVAQSATALAPATGHGAAGSAGVADGRVRELLRLSGDAPVGDAQRAVLAVLAFAEGVSPVDLTEEQVVVLATRMHFPESGSAPAWRSRATWRLRGWLLRRAWAVAELAVELYGPGVELSAADLKVVRRLYDVLASARRGTGRSGLVALARRVFGIDPDQYQAEHGQRLFELVDQVKVTRAKVRVAALVRGHVDLERGNVALEWEDAAWRERVASRVALHREALEELSVKGQRRALLDLLGPETEERYQYLAVAVVKATDDVELAEILNSAPYALEVRSALRLYVQAPDVRALLVQVVNERVVRGMEALAADAPVRTQGKPARKFSPEMLRGDVDTSTEVLLSLPDREVRKAYQYLRDALLGGPPPVRPRTPEQRLTDRRLHRLMHAVATQALSAGMLRAVTVAPSPSQVAAIRAILDGRGPAPTVPAASAAQPAGPAAEPVDGFAEGSPEAERYGEELKAAFLADLEGDESEYGVGLGRGRLFDPEHVLKILNLVRDQNNAAFRPFSDLKEPLTGFSGSPEDVVVDVLEYLGNLPEAEKVMKTRDLLRHHLLTANESSTGDVDLAYPGSLDLDRVPNAKSRIARKVIEEILVHPEWGQRWFEVVRESGESSDPGKKILMSRQRPAHDEDVPLNLWREKKQLGMHEEVHFREHPNFTSHVKRLGNDSQPGKKVREGLATLLHEMSWALVESVTGEEWKRLKQEVEGEFARHSHLKEPPPIDHLRYEQYVDAMQLVQVLGIERLMAFFFLGDTAKFVGAPDSRPIASAGEPEIRAEPGASGVRLEGSATAAPAGLPQEVTDVMANLAFTSDVDNAGADGSSVGLLREYGDDLDRPVTLDEVGHVLWLDREAPGVAGVVYGRSFGEADLQAVRRLLSWPVFLEAFQRDRDETYRRLLELADEAGVRGAPMRPRPAEDWADPAYIRQLFAAFLAAAVERGSDEDVRLEDLWRHWVSPLAPDTLALLPDESTIVLRSAAEVARTPGGLTIFDIFTPAGQARGRFEARIEEHGEAVVVSEVRNESDVADSELSMFAQWFASEGVDDGLQQSLRRGLEGSGWTLGAARPSGLPVMLVHAWTSNDPGWAPVDPEGRALQVVFESLDDGSRRRVAGRPVDAATVDGATSFVVVNPRTGVALTTLYARTGPKGQGWFGEVLSPADEEYFNNLAREIGWDSAHGWRQRWAHAYDKARGFRTPLHKAREFVQHIVDTGELLRADLAQPGMGCTRRGSKGGARWALSRCGHWW